MIRRKLKYTSIILFLLITLSPLSAESGASMGSISANTDLNGAFNFALTPSLTIGKFGIVFNLMIKGAYTTDPFSLKFDFSNYLMPDREESDSDWQYSNKIIKQVCAIIKTMHYGNRFDTFYFRYGKLENITLGDGALLSGFYDNSIGYLEARPGFDVKFGPVGHFGLEYITDDLFVSTMTAGRIYILPFANDNSTETKRINRLEAAFSFLFDPRDESDIKEGDVYKPLFLASYELSQPLFSGENGQTTFFFDFLTQGPKTDLGGGGKALRAGLWGRTKKWFSFNFSATSPVQGPYYCDYFVSGYNDSSSNEYGKKYPLNIGQVRLDGSFGLTMDSQQIYAGVRFRSNLDSDGFSAQRVLATVRIDRFLFNVLTLDLSYEKTYPDESEDFFTGLGTMKNVYISGHAQIKINGIKFVLSGTALFDSTAKVDYTMDMAVEIVVF